MENGLPVALQRLRATDIIRMAGLATASQGQEYYRAGVVQHTQRQGGRIAGVVYVSQIPGNRVRVAALGSAPSSTDTVEEVRRYSVEVDVASPTGWSSNCACGHNSLQVSISNGTDSVAQSQPVCEHAAALLYQWLARPMSFSTDAAPLTIAPIQSQQGEREQREQGRERATAMNFLSRHTPHTSHTPHTPNTPITQRGPVPLNNVGDMLTQIGLSELRSIAREYNITTNGLNRQELADAILHELQQPEAVRHVAATLEKPQRQLLAALSLAGGTMMDEDLRGLFDRFKLGQPNQLQASLLALQNKGLLFRTSVNSSPQQRIGLSGVLLDVGWHVPEEVRSALHVSAPVTRYSIEEHEDDIESIHNADSERMLSTLLLVARCIEEHHLSDDDIKDELNVRASSPVTRTVGTPTGDGSIALTTPVDTPSQAVLDMLSSSIPEALPTLSFALRILRLADILYKENVQTPLRVLPETAQLLLGPHRFEVLRDLFSLWLTQASYTELYELQTQHGLRLRVRATSQNQPLLRPGELDAENSEARQSLVALLAQTPVGQWIYTNAFARFLYRIDPLFLQKRQRIFSSPHWWIEQEAERPLHPAQLTDWLKAEYHYFTNLLRGPLHWWGLCDIALAHNGDILAFRLTPTAHLLFHDIMLQEQEDEYVATMPARSLQIVDTQTIYAHCSPTNWPHIETLERFTEIAGVRDGQLRYLVTPKALANAMSHGYRPEPLVSLLKTNIQNTHPELLAQLERWIRNYGRTRIYTGVTLLETADTVVMRELSATTSLDTQVVQTIHPTLALLDSVGAEQVIEELKRRGQTPLLHAEDIHGTH